ncbi:MAG TPA: hypothetical protein VK789_32625 [Bryobacteraceae bacterium]|jgi:hypothetical protein|nr:hypothetical protein [Bryobacteraceae bacterium]
MNRHLSSDEISAMVAGAPAAESASHLQTCAVCRSEVERLERVLGHFRGAVRDWSASEYREREVVKPRMRLWPGIAYACIVALILIVAAVGYRRPSRPSNSFESDTQLLKQVSADVSRSAPQGMETLLVNR